MMDTDRLSEILRESASDITPRPPVMPAGPPPRRRWILTVSALVTLLAVGTAAGMMLSNDEPGDGVDSAASDPSPSPQASSAKFDRVDRNGVSIEVPASWDVVEANDCSEGGLSTNAVVKLAGPVEECMGYRATAANRVYLTDLRRPPYGEPWDGITEDARSSNGVQIRRVTSGSLVGMNSAATLAITVPERDVAIIATGPNIDVTIRIMESVRVD
ncbi:hypothetical protein ABFU82_21820 [Nocardioides sp. WV_118_6]|uniref:hypothetical protein n=1 Tax=Nocardioides simplex TaxID=2045 RepID=UPI00214F6B5A|nr:hypothetical protein [Pimelobacter simplex]UUW91318.1 hypothetical protein M0M43_07460 [Pimelobacter simplex]UUW95146.1 hypothetical protein M0M48_25965 [Pimelobacter simplex]